MKKFNEFWECKKCFNPNENDKCVILSSMYTCPFKCPYGHHSEWIKIKRKDVDK